MIKKGESFCEQQQQQQQQLIIIEGRRSGVWSEEVCQGYILFSWERRRRIIIAR
jgi:hypothetical protein